MDHKRLLDPHYEFTDKLVTEKREEVRKKMTELMFEPIVDEQDIQDTLNGRSRKGYATQFLSGLNGAYETFRKTNKGRPFIVPLNEREGSAFFGKSTDSLYATLHGQIKKNDMQNEWRLVRIKKGDDTFLRIVRL